MSDGVRLYVFEEDRTPGETHVWSIGEGDLVRRTVVKVDEGVPMVAFAVRADHEDGGHSWVTGTRYFVSYDEALTFSRRFCRCELESDGEPLQ